MILNYARAQGNGLKTAEVRASINAGPIQFPPSNFKHSLTLFSKFFASFPHGTCSLSDSRRYLALDEIYHLISAPIPGNATLRARTGRGTCKR